MLKDRDFEALQKLAKGVAAQFGSDCEVVVHRLSADTMEHSIVAIENGHVTGRKVATVPPMSCWNGWVKRLIRA